MRQFAVLAVLVLAGCAPPPRQELPASPTPGMTTALNAHVPPFARWPYQPFSREAAVQIALREWRAFGQQVVLPNMELPVDEERQGGLWQRAGASWWGGRAPSRRQP